MRRPCASCARGSANGRREAPRSSARAALQSLAGESRPFDLVFLDPPFASELLSEAARMLEERHWLKPGALIYLECAARTGPPALPAPWRPLRAKQAGEVGYHLFGHAAPYPPDTA